MPPRILIVDDESGIRAVLSELRKERGFEISMASTGEEGLKVLTSSFHHVMILDIGLPDIKGTQLLADIESLSPDTEVILISGQASVATAIEAVHKHAYDYITKPFKLGLLLESIEGSLEHQRLRMENRRMLGQLKFLNAVSSEMLKTMGLEKILKQLLFISMTHYHAESGAIYLRSSDSWVLRQHIGVTKKFVSDFERIPLEHPIVRDAMRASISFTNREEMDAAASSTASVPLTYMERAVGVMILIARVGRFEEEDRHMLSIVGAQAGSAIINSISRRQTQEELRSLESLVKYSADAIITYSLDGMVEDWNPAAQALYGYTEVEASGRYLLIVPEDQLGEMRDITARVAKGELVSGIETVRVCKDGSLVQVSATYSPLKDPQGKIVGFSSISRDISNRRSAQRRETAPISEDWLRRMREMMADMLPLALQHRMPEEHRSAFILMLAQKLDDAFYAHYFGEDGHIDLIDFGEGMTRLLNDFGGEFEPLVNDSSLTLIGRRCPWNNENLRRPINCHLTKGVCAQFAMHALGNVTISLTESLANSDGCCSILIRKLT